MAEINCNPPKTDKVLPWFITEAMHLYFDARVQKSWQGHHILCGKTPNERALIASSNDYLAISQHPALIEAQTEALCHYGNGLMQSPVFLSDNSLLKSTEKAFAQFLHYPAAILSQSGWCANIGLIQALAKRDLPVYLDFYTHMSFWEGAKSAGAKIIPFQHNCTDSLRKRLERFGSGIIAVDSIYSTTGDISPLEDYVQLAKTYNCLLVVDESHSLGTHGPQGSGLVRALKLGDDVDIITASLAKAISGRGGLIAASPALIELIRYTALPTIFSSSLLPQDLAGFKAALNIIDQEEWRRVKLHDNSQFLRQALTDAGLNLYGSNSQIIPLVAGSERNTIWLRDQLEHANIHASVFCSPATPKNGALIRLSINANHDKSALSKIVECLSQLDPGARDIPLFYKTDHST